MSLSDRIRPNCEAAPWVVEEVKKLERKNAALRTDKDILITAVELALFTVKKDPKAMNRAAEISLRVAIDAVRKET